MPKKCLILFISSLILFTAVFLQYRINPQFIEKKVYDLAYKNIAPRNFDEAQKILLRYEQISSENLPVRLKTHRGLSFYKIPYKDAYQFLFQKNRIVDFTSKELRPLSIAFKKHDYFYLCLSISTLKVLFKLSEELVKLNLDPSAIKINSGFRTIVQNDKAKGALNSMHLYGRALDLRIGDIDYNGKIEFDDKEIVYKILDQKIIRNSGGLGYYPKTMIVHFDTRGVWARWDQYKRPG